ncbi:glycoside hydrolase family 15 protein [Sphaerisporangium sp. TRM90804]|uniref:glycoside hydrolase family 15 protein n=1 Tax=Sphaerisporangium sp. TRM90804 TaxID=3031113 RepID=UPI00244A6C5A|nr:glycoside hydrolase family 15 protein [Sphaerisporangium sp. TRM90804]MDH2429135.1 glycoside hydrolase family 15 protein [Sphaerisporangium sp. TRM90804]
MTNKAIADYALLSDRHSAALVARDGAVDWLCMPRFDSPSVFAALLDDGAGTWSLRPSGAFEVSRRYVDSTMVLETTFTTPAGTLVLTDALVVGQDCDVHRLGADAPHALAREARCTRGSVELEVLFRPRPSYGRVVPLLSAVPGGIDVKGGPGLFSLSSPVELDVDRERAAATVALAEGRALRFALRGGPIGDPPPGVWTGEEIAARLEATVAMWQAWSAAHQRYDGPYRDLVGHSGRVLQALTYEPTGAVVAAPTTSLPEVPGGERNWDYRYSWVRDASFTLNALWVAACPDEAGEFLSFMTTAAVSYDPEGALQIVFGIGGEYDLTEHELPHLSGWRDSRPVRIGNDAWRQPQIDVYGELLDAVHRLSGQLGALDGEARAFLVALADAAVRHWREPDHGIWEIREPRMHHVYSKVMCWVAVDRAILLADLLEAGDRVEGWRAAREEIRETVLREGWNEEAGAYTQAFGSTTLDASALMMPIVGFLAADDPRMLATIDAVAARLVDEHGLVYRYRADDGLPGREGAFLLCTYWLAQALALAGRVEEAHVVFRRAAAFVNDVGLQAEEVCPRTSELLGNFPQAFSHIGLVNAAWAVFEAQRPTSSC